MRNKLLAIAAALALVALGGLALGYVAGMGSPRICAEVPAPAIKLVPAVVADPAPREVLL